MVEDDVGASGEPDGLLGQCERFSGVAAHRQDLCLRRTSGNRRLWVLAGEGIAVGGEFVGLVEAALQQQRPGEIRGGLAGVGADAELAEPPVGAAQMRLGGDRLPGQ